MDVPTRPPSGTRGLGQGTETRSQLVLITAHGLRLLLALATTAFLGRHLAPQDFGFFTLVGTLFLFGQLLLDAGTGTLAVREIARHPVRERALLEGLLGWRRLLGLGLGTLLAALALTQGDPERRYVLLGVAGGLVLLAPGGLAVVFQLRQAFEGPAAAGVALQLALLGGCVLLERSQVTGAVFAWLVVLREVAGAGVIHRLAVRRLGYRPRPGLRGRALGAFLLSSVVPAAAVLIQAAYFHIDVLLVRGIRGESELGAYAAAYRPIVPLLALPGLLVFPMLPVLSGLALRDRESFRQRVAAASAVVLGLGALGATAGVCLAPELLGLLYGSRYLAGPLEAVTSFRWLCLALGCVFAAAPLTSALMARGSERFLLRLGCLALILNVAGNLALLPRLGFVAAAATTAATEFVVLAGAVTAWTKGQDRNIFSPGHLRCLIPALLVAPVLLVLPGGAGLRVAIGCVVGLGGVAVLLRLPEGRRLRALLGQVIAGEG